MKPRSTRRLAPGSSLATLGAALTLVLPVGAPADPPSDGPRRSSSLGATPLGRPQPPAWMGENLHFRKGYGLEYRRSLALSGEPLEVSVLGPVVRKKKSVGLTVEIRF